MSKTTFTGRTRSRRSRGSVRFGEGLARSLITIGGAGTIAAVVMIMVFLVWVVTPMFLPGRVDAKDTVSALGDVPQPQRLEIDQYGKLGWVVDRGGILHTFHVPDGRLIGSIDPSQGAKPSCYKVDPYGEKLVYGFEDGSVRLGSVLVETKMYPQEKLDPARRPVGADTIQIAQGRLVELLPDGHVREQTVQAILEAPLVLTAEARIVALDRCDASAGSLIAALDDEWTVHLRSERRTLNMMTEEWTSTFAGGSVSLRQFADRGFPIELLLTGSGDSALLVWSDGRTVRLDTRDLDAPVIAEELDLVVSTTATVTSLAFLNGQTTVLVGDSEGNLSTWFAQRVEGSPASDGRVFTMAQRMACGSPVRSLAISRRTRVAAAGLDDGSVVVVYATLGRILAKAQRPGEPRAPGDEQLLCLSPKDNQVHQLDQGRLWSVELDIPHPEVSVQGLFRPVLYEGESEPLHVWQSSSGTDDFEPKLGLVPLIFGTLKATLYSMLFGVPLAILAALYTSEFLQPNLRVPIKSAVEIMAGLPSVVLGFLSAIVIAPFVQNSLATVLGSFYTIPSCLLLGSYVWQLLPHRTSVRWEGWPRMAAIACMIPLGVVLAGQIGPWTERALFGGDLASWLSSSKDGGWGGWFVLLLPLSAVAIAALWGWRLAPWMRRISAPWSRATCARFELLRFLLCAGATLLLAFAVSWLLQSMGMDPRGGLVGTYVQRNALVVGFVMGFAIIPIIYTIAEDALSSVPSHLRLASLGAGATHWQTSLRVVLPTAMSGIFSAVMVGLGRAVGETMIVLMATGNTAVMEWNVFNGFRTLSANIAVELPEAVRNDTHYRTLFLAALTLFAMTFLVNTAAETVRQRFRKRAYQL